MKTTVVIPCYKSKNILIRVIKKIPKFVNNIILIDDKCPNNTVRETLKKIKDKRIITIFNIKNLGVGGSVLKGYKKALELKSDIIIKVDSDGQLDLSKMKKFYQILSSDNSSAYVKANRFFSLKSLLKMPKIRMFGNIILTFLNKFSSGYWSINDPTNGYTAIKSNYCKKLQFNKIKKNFFFESDLLFHLNCLNAKVIDINVEAKYDTNNASNLVIYKVIPYFIKNHIINFIKRLLKKKILLLLYIFNLFVLILSYLISYKDIYIVTALFIFITIIYDISTEPK